MQWFGDQKCPACTLEFLLFEAAAGETRILCRSAFSLAQDRPARRFGERGASLFEKHRSATKSHRFHAGSTASDLEHGSALHRLQSDARSGVAEKSVTPLLFCYCHHPPLPSALTIYYTSQMLSAHKSNPEVTKFLPLFFHHFFFTLHYSFPHYSHAPYSLPYPFARLCCVPRQKVT